MVIELVEDSAEKIETDGLCEGEEDGLEKLLEYSKFKPGAIHDVSVYEFWEKELEAPNWILEILRDGYKIPFKEEPGSYYERNNKVS